MTAKPKIGGTVERANGKTLLYSDFVEKYLKRNRPVVLTGLTDGWKAREDWVTSTGAPNLRFFAFRFARSVVRVSDCRSAEQDCAEMTVADFVSRWPQRDAGGGGGESDGGGARPLLYLKDWHFVKEYPDYVAYTTSPFFADDWLNMYLDSYSMHGERSILQDKNEINCSDYRFVYMGPKGTWTPLHADVFRSYSWSANICGKKLWYFLPPSQSHLLFDRYLKNSVYDIFGVVSEKKFPGFKETVWLECTQEKDEIVFVPSGWYHQVHNLEDTISINHNWFNGYNLQWVWKLLLRDYKEAKGYIEDVREICNDFEGLCQRNLVANTGMNFYDFFMFLTRSAFANLIHIFHYKISEEPESSSKKLQFLIFNVSSICRVALGMKCAEAFSFENSQTFASESSVLSNINLMLDEYAFSDLHESFGKTCRMLDEPQEVNIKLKNASVFLKCCSQLKHSIASLCNLDDKIAADFKYFDPEALATIIEGVIADMNNLYGGLSTEEPLELLGHEILAVL